MTFVETIHIEYFFEDVLTDLIPSAFEILVYNGFTSREIKYELSGIESVWLILLKE